MTTYTFFLRGFAPLGREVGLSLSHAFDRVVNCSGYHHSFEEEDGRVVLVLSESRAAETDPPIVIRATAEIETDAEREVMALAMDGRLGGFMAVPDADYAGYLRAPAAEIDRAAIRFLIRAALKTHIHVIPKVRKMQTGHAKRMLDASVEALADAVAAMLAGTGVQWRKPPLNTTETT